jgi:hypothetical protein
VTKRRPEKLSDLLKRVRCATEYRGKKSELARWLKTTPQRVTDWLSGTRAPGGEVTLRLLEWVQEEEAKTTEALAVSLAPPEPKTQLRKSSYEKTKSGQSKR